MKVNSNKADNENKEIDIFNKPSCSEQYISSHKFFIKLIKDE